MGNNANVTYYYPNIIAGIMLLSPEYLKTGLTLYNRCHILQSTSYAIINFMCSRSKKKTHPRMSHFTWQRAIFTGACPDIVAADMLNFCVRDEYRCVHIAIATRSL